MNAPIHLMTSMLTPELFLFNFMRYSLLFLGHRIRPISFWKSRRQLWCPGNEIKQSQREGNQLIYDWIKLRKSLYFTVKTLSLHSKENTVQCNLWGWRAYMKIFTRTIRLTDWRAKFLAMLINQQRMLENGKFVHIETYWDNSRNKQLTTTTKKKS